MSVARWYTSPLTAVVAFQGCASAGTPSVELAPQEAWVARAIQDSAATLEVRCAHHAPLDIVMSDAPSYRTCERMAGEAASSAQERVYVQAVRACEAHVRTTGEVDCCFSQVTDRADFEADRKQRCEAECASRSGRSPPQTRPSRSAGSSRCESAFVSPSRSGPSRALTAAVASAARNCQSSGGDLGKCDGLSSNLERSICADMCAAADRMHNSALRECIDDDAGGKCRESLPPRMREHCTKECRARRARQRSGPTHDE